MNIRIICNYEELQREEEIQELFTPIMSHLTEKGFIGTIQIEKEEAML